MKLLQKLTAALVAGSCAVLIGNGYLRVVRETSALEEDRVRVHDVVATSLSGAVAAVWRTDGPTRALAVLDATNARDAKIRVHWLANDLPTAFDERARAEVATGHPVTQVVSRSGADVRVTVDEVRVDDRRVGFVEVTEPLAAEEAAIHGIVADTIKTTIALALMCGALSIILGFWFVGRPVRALSEKARRIGRGDFTGPVVLKQRDELSVLAGEMNAMCERLERETAARISALEQLRHADRLTTVGKLASGVAHELGTPLNVVSARAQMIMEKDTDAAEAKQYARVIVESCGKMTRIIKQLLAFARPKPATKALIDLGKLAAETLDLLRPLSQKARVTLVLQRAPDEKLTLLADSGQVQQVLTNLVMNAVQASSPEKKSTVRVEVAREHRARADALAGSPEVDFVAVRVKDEGKGIESSHIAHVFEPFFTTKDVGEGTGLGLSVTHGIVQEHGGFITLASKVGEGTEFIVYFPVGDVAITEATAS